MRLKSLLPPLRAALPAKRIRRAGGPSFALSANGGDSRVQGPWDSDSFSEGCAGGSGSASIRSEAYKPKPRESLGA
jgi:hypothetical protein